MGIYGAINSAVSGLTAQAHALENISGNVANSQTTGFKRLDTTFSDLVAGGGSTQATQVSGTTFATSRATNSIQGDITSVEVDTYMAINGDGYFVVTKAADIVDGSTTFAEETYYTRAGDFELDREGHFINASGYYLQGFPLDATTGNPIGDAPTVIQIQDTPLAASASTIVDYQANLPRIPATNNYDGSDPATSLLAGAVGAGNVAVANEQAFLDSSVSGGSITIYNTNGTAMNVEVRYAKTLNYDAGVPQNDTWTMYIGSGGDATTAYYDVGNIEFDTNGALTAMTAGAIGTVNGTGDGFDLASLTVAGTTTTGVAVSFANGSLTQYSDPDGTTSSVALEQNGYPAGELLGVAVDDAGRVIASYSNNEQRAVYQIPLATFEAEQDLQRVDGAAFAATSASGNPDLTGGGQVLSNKLELSNADIADEFSKLIITQQAYSANSKVVTSADEMLDDALNMVR